MSLGEREARIPSLGEGEGKGNGKSSGNAPERESHWVPSLRVQWYLGTRPQFVLELVKSAETEEYQTMKDLLLWAVS